MATFQDGMAPIRAIEDDSDVEEEALVADYKEQVRYEDGLDDEPAGLSMAQQTDDIQSRLAQAAQPLDFSAPLEAKFTSYDQYCSLFHFILNSEGPVDLEPPSVRPHNDPGFVAPGARPSVLTFPRIVLLGLGCYRRVHLSVQFFLLVPRQNCAARE